MAAQLPASIGERPSHSITQRVGEKLELKAGVKCALIYMTDCRACEAYYPEKAAKLTIHHCSDMIVNINSSIISGTLELIGCKNITLNVHECGKINILQTDNSHSVNVNLLTHIQLESVYLHQSSNIEIWVGVESPNKYHVTTPPCFPKSYQFVAYWKDEGGKLDLACERVIREGAYPTTETKLKEAKERAERDMEKLATALVAGISVKPKARGQAAAAATKPSSKPDGHIPRPAPGANFNIEDEEEKKEYFDSTEELDKKLDKLAQWIKGSKHCIVFTGAGISTSTGIPDFRSSMNTVLRTGPGVWELRAKGQSSSRGGGNFGNVLKAIPSPAHMALVKLHEEGLVKFTISQNVDGLHLRSGIRSDQLAELHGNTNLEKCTKCGRKYLRDFSTRTAQRVHDHRTGRHCDDSNCYGQLVDSIINFGEGLPEDELAKSFDESSKSDLCIVLGSSLRVFPAADIPAQMIKRGAKVVICNLQKTPLNKTCAMEIHEQIDPAMSGLMEKLGHKIPHFKLKRRFVIDTTVEGLQILGYDFVHDIPYSYIKEAHVILGQKEKYHPDMKILKDQKMTKEPFYVRFPGNIEFFKAKPICATITLSFHSHYNEPGMILEEEITGPGRWRYIIEYDTKAEQWITGKEEL